jgi:hypothetical protein
MPATIPVPHDIYAAELAQGSLDLRGCPCPRCSEQGGELPLPALELTDSIVKRGIFLLVRDCFALASVVERTIGIALGRCRRCRMRPRILPCDVLPRKLYALAVIAETSGCYVAGAHSLRKVVWDEIAGERTPAHTTLHGWTEGMGAWARDRPGGEIPEALPGARIVSELRGRLPEAARVDPRALSIDPRRFRSEARRERLLGAKYLRELARTLGTPVCDALQELNRLVLTWCKTCFGVGFRSGLSSTPIEHVGRSSRAGSPRQPLPAREPTCVIRGRSPPGDSNR